MKFNPKWFQSSAEFDELVRQKFGALVEAVSAKLPHVSIVHDHPFVHQSVNARLFTI